MNIISKNKIIFYPFFLFSPNNRKTIDKTEKETFVIFMGSYLKLKNINARFLLKSYQPIHKLINSSTIF